MERDETKRKKQKDTPGKESGLLGSHRVVEQFERMDTRLWLLVIGICLGLVLGIFIGSAASLIIYLIEKGILV